MEANLTKRDGKVSMDRPFDLLCSLLRNGDYTVKIVRKTKQRTISQNNLMWMWFQCLADTSGSSKEEWHDYMCTMFLSKEVMIGGKIVSVVGGTKHLNTLQMSSFMEQVQAYAAREEGVTLPLPADDNYADFVDYYKIR